MIKFYMNCKCGSKAKFIIKEDENEVINASEILTGAIFKCQDCGRKYITGDWDETFALSEEDW